MVKPVKPKQQSWICPDCKCTIKGTPEEDGYDVFSDGTFVCEDCRFVNSDDDPSYYEI